MKKSLFYRNAICCCLILLLSAGMFTGCAQKEGESLQNGGNPSQEAAGEKTDADTRTVVDVTGREVEMKKEIKHTVITAAGHGGAFMTMCALLGEDVVDYIAGWDNRLKTDNLDMYENFIKYLPELDSIADVGSIFRESFNVEKLIEINPDICIFSAEEKEAVEATIASKLNKAGIPYVYVEYVDETTENQEKSTRLLGEIFNKTDRAEELIDYCIGKRNEIENRVKDIVEERGSRPKVYFECAALGVDEYGYTYSNMTQWGLMTDKAGGNNISEGKVSKYGNIDLEYLLREDPEYIIFSGAYWVKAPTSLRMGYKATEAETQQQLKEFMSRKGWDQLQAVKNNQVYAIYHSLGCEMFDFVSLEFIAKAIYPDEFKDIEPLEDLYEYFDQFMPFDLEGVWMTRVEQ